MNERKLNNELEALRDFKVFNPDTEWKHFLDKVDATNKSVAEDIPLQHSTQSPKIVRLPHYFAAIAAGLLVLLVSTIAFLNLQEEEPTIVQTTPNLIHQVETPVEIVTPAEIVTPEEIVEPPVQESVSPPVIEEQEVIAESIATVKVEAETPVKADYIRIRPDETFALRDGSTIKALTTTLIRVPDSFEGAVERLINLTSGTAIFDITENQEKPFRVLTDNAGFSVLGTSFRIIKDGVNNTLKTLTGEVKFYSRSDESISAIVTKGQEFTFDGNKMVDIAKPVEVAEEEPKAIPEPEPMPEETPLETSKYNLKALLENSWIKYYSDNVKINLKDVDEAIQMETFEIPTVYVSSGAPENITKTLEILQKKFNIDVEKLDDCEHCYKINSIKAKN